jgi:2-polyprenyl-3-methyl-5-hydroxy-6-metoxy-1,4-benzoquinol methylase
VTAGYADMLKGQGIRVSSPRRWPIEWLCFRQHPCPHWPGVEMYREELRNDRPVEPVVLCRWCFTILDGWHRTAAHWLEQRRYIDVVLADAHWMDKETCKVEKTHWLHTLRPYADLDFVSGAYHPEDWKQPSFAALKDDLAGLYHSVGGGMPTMRFWEQIRAVAFLGNVHGKKILDVGTRESIVPTYLTTRGAEVTAIDLTPELCHPYPGVTIEKGDATALKYEDESFDAVLSTACVKHIPGWGDRVAVREMARVVKKGGVVAVSFDYGPTYEPYPSEISGRRIYDERTVMSRLVRPSGLELVGPVDFSLWNPPKEQWPIRTQAGAIFDKGYNLQVGFILLRKV